MSTTLPHTRFDSPLGPIWITAAPDGLLGFWFHDQKHLPPPDERRHWTEDRRHPLLLNAQAQLRGYFGGARQAFDLPLSSARGTPFQRSVWRALQDIPWGRTCSYGELARAVGRPEAVRAVAAAVGHNPWSIVVPCHRVLGARGALTGYAGGLERKAALLQLEQKHAPT